DLRYRRHRLPSPSRFDRALLELLRGEDALENLAHAGPAVAQPGPQLVDSRQPLLHQVLAQLLAGQHLARRLAVLLELALEQAAADLDRLHLLLGRQPVADLRL